MTVDTVFAAWTMDSTTPTLISTTYSIDSPTFTNAGIESLSAKYLKPTGSYETFSRAQATVSSVAFPAAGTVALQAIALPKSLLVTNIKWICGATAAITPAHWWFSLCDSSFITLRSTADQTSTAIAANTVYTKALSSTFTTTYEGLHYIAILHSSGTQPSSYGCSLTGSTIASQAPRVSLVGITGQTGAPSDGTNLATSPGNPTGHYYAYVT